MGNNSLYANNLKIVPTILDQLAVVKLLIIQFVHTSSGFILLGSVAFQISGGFYYTNIQVLLWVQVLVPTSLQIKYLKMAISTVGEFFSNEGQMDVFRK